MAKKKQKTFTVGFIALGCPKNIVDSEKMLAHIGEAGFAISGDPENADAVVINTCGFIAPAKEEAIEAIRETVRQKEAGNVRKVIVAGCLPQRLGDELLKEVPGIDAVVGLGQRDRIAEIIRELLVSRKPGRSYFAGSDDTIHDDRGRLLITPGHWAYLRISEGCNRKCAFCTIPAIRGKFRSKPEETVLSEANELVDNGAVELSIIAQDSNFYGRDMGMENGLVKLLGGLEKIDALQWIRLMYLYPAGIDEMLIETIAGSEKIVNYIDMPAQHINNEILKAMRRSDTKEKTYSLIERLRSAMSDVVLRTTVIVGFPGETDAQFAELLEFVKWARFDALGCFKFYREEGTAAAELAGQVPEDIKQQRSDTLMEAQQQIAFEKNKECLGREITCLLESEDESAMIGRHYGQAPHIDSVCIVENCTSAIGEFIRAKVIGSDGYDLVVEQIND